MLDTTEHRTLKEIQPLLTEVLDRLQAQFGEELRSVVVYGSYARGEADADSDVDMMVVVGHLPKEWTEIFAIEDSLMQMGQELGRRLDIRLVEPSAVSYSVTWAAPLMLEVHDAHQIIFDPTGIFAAAMSRFTEVVRQRGIAKIARGVWRVPPLADRRGAAGSRWHGNCRPTSGSS
jgi:predicted nucleotidyltransferase